ncbi:hypothetical protein CRI77_01925 [Mycolicibacterium duvalii]|uniref:Uncharacterized protein n=1 Tax=Mycolicibacterium duvalii TaxID=39688 RepID=A0A7I7K499_9MYCO|nr:DUF2599 domain-containing protein [Mycolicibacterium duvalii]MCV7367516.1 DUF2599 domain-containing protein [Mycolicibacterium duvalii]PEG44157.1 hypothetical protein CRI77_01925 [Mycolicibacterium duvalii]BBX18893.1 hypothetical protein MDUV_37530 [Mycolicibacterium duvalii]
MRRAVLAAVAAAGVLPVVLAPSAAATPAGSPPPYVDHVEWAKWGDLSSLRVYPTPAGRDTSGRPGAAPAGEQAWAEVLTLSPDAEIPGMKEQFFCHWKFAEIFEPGKTSWNLEPWRPLVSPDQLVATGCNPGGTEEPF